MAIKIMAQRDFLVTEVSIELPCDLAELEFLVKTSRGSGRIVAMYQKGGTLGVNIEQKTRIKDNVADRVRSLVGVESTEINGHEE
jgi:hypothetical protein